MQALMMQQEALLTRDVKRSPLTVVVALAEVLAPLGGSADGAGAGPNIVGAHSSGGSIVAHMFNDGGEEVEVSAVWLTICLMQAVGCRLLRSLGCWVLDCQQCGSLDTDAACVCVISHVGARRWAPLCATS